MRSTKLKHQEDSPLSEASFFVTCLTLLLFSVCSFIVAALLVAHVFEPAYLLIFPISLFAAFVMGARVYLQVNHQQRQRGLKSIKGLS